MLLGAALAACALHTSDAQSQSTSLERCAAQIVAVRAGQYRHGDEVLSIRRGDGHLVVFGVEHSRDPDHPQFVRLIELFEATEPTLVLYEGEGGSTLGTPDEAIRAGGESGLLRYLASQTSSRVASLEPPQSAIVAHLLGLFSPEQVQLFLLLRRVHYLSMRYDWERVRATIDAHIGTEFAPTSAVRWPIQSFSDLETSFERTWPEYSIREMPETWFDPRLRVEGVFLNDVNAAESDFRNEHVFRRLAAALIDGDRVFAAIGRGHMPSLAPALACLGSEQSASRS
jgi:hypothetical protein